MECCKEPCNIAIILFLAIDPSFVCVGTSSLLLDLAFHNLCTPYNGCNSVVLLKVNEKYNPNAYNFMNIGDWTRSVEGHHSQQSWVPPLQKRTSWLVDFAHENPCLQWVRKVLKSSSSLPESTVVRTLRYKRFFTNPFSTTDQSVYAILPGYLNFQQSDRCVDNSKDLWHDAFIGDGPLDPNLRINLPRGFKPTCVLWVNRCFQETDSRSSMIPWWI